jgi:hypothetical protein
MIIGVDYQPGGQASYKPSEGKDVLNDADVCLRDAILMQRLGASLPLRCAARLHVVIILLTTLRSTLSESTTSILSSTTPLAPPSSTLRAFT